MCWYWANRKTNTSPAFSIDLYGLLLLRIIRISKCRATFQIERGRFIKEGKNSVITNRVIWIVLDSVGMGPMPDSHAFGDEEPNTLGHIAQAIPGFSLPVMESIGLGNIDGMVGYQPVANPSGAFARMAEFSAGKDTTIGHWEMAGIQTTKPLPTYPNGFGPEIIQEFEARIGRGTLGNKPASGTAIIAELGDEHVATGKPIIYTSADSVFQIAAHEAVIPLMELYHMCQIARDMLTGENGVARVIARPFVGTSGTYVRTANRRDFSLKPDTTVLDLLKAAGHSVAAVGKIEDIFAGQGITFAVHTQSNLDGMQQTEACMEKFENGLIFVNLVDFDMKYGHRRDAAAYAAGLTEFDHWLGTFLPKLKPSDLLLITADHGCDPTHKGTDHTREYVPLLMYGKDVTPGTNYGTRSTFADVGQTVAKVFNVGPLKAGIALLPK